MKLYLIVLLTSILSCSSKGDSNVQSTEENEKVQTVYASDMIADPGVILTMEGETHILKQEDLNPQTKLDFERDDLKFAIYTNDGPVSINLNLTQTGILEAGAANYSIPEANQPSVKVDLNFFNQNRESSRTNKRIVFRKGEIKIEKITKNQLILTFNGEGSGMTERGELFPVEGSINMSY
ncbi:hypothetical protein [Algoriphagus sp.]|uniref:hypothetical protein n=1 Tax=Algoriphagus sp. TaxID=1872435 RepID=UPI0025D64674|nr:hypothetical protein [Algoriphagus sp.]